MKFDEGLPSPPQPLRKRVAEWLSDNPITVCTVGAVLIWAAFSAFTGSWPWN